MTNLMQDIRYAIRLLAKTPASTAVIVITLALGIGANALIFSIVNGVLLRPLPVPHPGQIAVVAASRKGDFTLGSAFSYPAFADFRKQAGAIGDLFGYTLGVRGLSSGDRADQVLAAFVTGNYFTALGVQPSLGRLIRPEEEDRPGDEATVVLGYSYWQRRFGRNPAVLASEVRLNGQTVRVIGVAAQGFTGTQMLVEPDIYIPISQRSVFEQSAGNALSDRSVRTITALARLKAGVSFGHAQSAMDLIAGRLAKQYPATEANVTVRVYREPLARPFPTGNYVVPAIVAFFLVLAALLLMLACMNVANLVLAQSIAKQREFALRAALGAGRSRLIRQELTQTVLLGILGGIAGIVLGNWMDPGDISNLSGGSLPIHFDYSFDWRVFAYSLAAALFTGILVGVVPALRAARADLNMVLQEGGRSGTSGKRHRLRSILVSAQVAGSLMLLIAAGLLVRSLGHAQNMYLGFDPDGLLNVTLAPNEIGYDKARTNAFYRELETRVRALAGVESVSLAYAVPLGGLNAAYTAAVSIEGQQLRRDQPPPALFYNNVDASYFETMRIRLQRGRAFTDLDNENATPVAVVNEAMAARFWPGEDALGKRFSIKTGPEPAKTVQIVGVVPDGKYIFIGEGSNPIFYVPLAQSYTAMRVLQVRTSADPTNMMGPVEQQIHKLAPDLPIVNQQTMRQTVSGYLGLWIYRAGAELAAGMGAIGLILAVVGIYGLISFTVAQRTREIGIRMALGGSASDVLRLVLARGFRMLVAGLAIGFLGALAMSRAMTHLLIGVSPSDPLTYVAVAALLSAVALAACWIPARRATRVDPGIALRYE